jgi:CheY-specific phosphatase CheX
MQQQLESILTRVAEETLERLAFLFSYPEDAATARALESGVTARVAFTGPVAGALMIHVSEAVLPELTENMLGESDVAFTLDEQQDALRELLNVICGNLLPEIAGKKAIFNIMAPEILSAAPTDFAEGARLPAARVIRSLDEGQCDFYLFFDGEFSPAVPDDGQAGSVGKVQTL